jgi:transposase
MGEAMGYFIGLDISQRSTSVCIIDEKGKRVCEGKVLTIPSDIHGWIVSKGFMADQIDGICLEAGAMSSYLYNGLTDLGYGVTCVEAHQASIFLKAQRNKTDKNDARGLAQYIRIGGDFIRPVIIRNVVNQQDRLLLTLRQTYVSQRVAIENGICGVLKPFGLIVRRGNLSADTFCTAVRETLAKADSPAQNLRESVLESLDAYRESAAHLDRLTKRIRTIANGHPICRLMMSIPGVGPVIALSYVTAIDTPERFRRPEDIGAYFGLTPKKYQSGEVDVDGAISRRGNSMTRMHLVQAATVLLHQSKKWSSLRAWGMKIAKRRGAKTARVAVARKLAIIMHRMWMTGEVFRMSNDIDVSTNSTASAPDSMSVSA